MNANECECRGEGECLYVNSPPVSNFDDIFFDVYLLKHQLVTTFFYTFVTLH
jgi:hypothetical protein